MKTKVLIFEDQEFTEDIYFKKFNELGFDVKGFENYSNVVEVVVKEKPDIIYCDILMPSEIDGFGAIGLLKADERTKHIPIVVVTNLSEDQDKKRALNLGAVDFIVKPFKTPTEVVKIFMAHLSADRKE